MTEAIDNDMKYELLGSRSGTNLSLSHAITDSNSNSYYITKNSIHSNIVMPSGDTPLTETDKPTKVSTGSNLLVRCYGKYGCFSIAEPFLSIYRPINLYPIPVDILKVEFLLKTRRNAEKFEKIIAKNDGSYDILDFNPKNDLKIIIHGYLEHGFQSWIKDMSIELLSKSDYNIISIDWMIGANPPYTQAVANARLVAAIAVQLLKSIQKQYVDYSALRIHLIGHSLGAHIAGYIGQRFAGLGRITGLDPAEPYFQNTDPSVRLDKSDAMFVDVIHTDASSIITGGFGMSQGCGHVDFYPNGGWRQPGCSETPLKTVFDSIGKERNVIHGPFMAYECSSYDEFASGLCTKGKNSCPFSHQLLDNNSHSNRTDRNDLQSLQPLQHLQCLQMGFNAHKSWSSLHKYMNTNPQTARSEGSRDAKYFLWTSDRTPYCLFHYRIQLIFRSDISTSFPEKGRLFVQVFGTKGSTQSVDATKDAQLSESIDFVISSANIGSVVRLELQYKSSPTLVMNLKNNKKLNAQLSESIDFVISSANIGSVVRLELQYKSSPTLVMNPLRWRLNDSNDSNQIYLIQITVTNLETGYK
ncbi:unnamed protein product [Medioppia subpectinata]|uniref:C3H1-type domain-containing protein n=1 Tax=Medioppia subpectinata TaxID=1979941 RepID=A0A7R9Q157_9ACAR|nr:unnamed protein product [Medioppia subpectinata]CAG2108845.1 unnamed protein product [Medioppia subpectinata]